MERKLSERSETSDRTDELAVMTRLEAAVRLLGLGLYAWNPQTNALEWDARLKAIWGLPRDAYIDYAGWRERIHLNDLARVDAAVAKSIDPNGDGVYDIEYRCLLLPQVWKWHRRVCWFAGQNGLLLHSFPDRLKLS